MAKRVNSKGAFTSGIKQGLMVEGKSGRSEHWVWFMFYLFGTVGLSFANIYVGGAFFIILFAPTISMHVRRIHDAGHSGFWLLLPPVAFVFLLKKTSTAASSAARRSRRGASWNSSPQRRRRSRRGRRAIAPGRISFRDRFGVGIYSELRPGAVALPR